MSVFYSTFALARDREIASERKAAVPATDGTGNTNAYNI